MTARTIVSLSGAFGLLSLGKAIGSRGDAFAEASTRLGYHLSALALVLGALALFIYAGLSAFRRGR